ncbi:hypothetical protein CJP74_07865 [Psittacicella melopsittaci]|uniref:8-oxo-dGTP diphosphatase n=1 Tax=Psittacicella melopsittaci TaxID=2028576 RepID=A0A3A1Y174_9GAMM|nr:8-oxo-dGTP diphosphatase MutT [Psittacicella melopsittaci]RIY31211.1 hypothetical protein CJP74_07865 [Psittacicella melopsittaci]
MEGLPQKLENIFTNSSLSQSATSLEEQHINVVDGANPFLSQEELDNIPDHQIRHVVCGVIFNEYGQVLVSRRRAGVEYANSLEFPGGKVEHHETHEQALLREFEEEVGITVANFKPIYDQRVNGSSEPFHIYFYLIKDFFGQPYGAEGQDVFWLNVDEIDYNRFPPATQLLIQNFILTNEYLNDIYRR